MHSDEFETLTNAEWKQLILKTIKADSEAEKIAFYQQKLVQQPEPGVNIQPFYTQEDMIELDYLKGFHRLWTQTRQTTGWMNIERIAVHDETIANQQAREALANGADAVLFNLLNRPGGKPMLSGEHTQEHAFDFSVLLREIPLARIPVYYEMRSSQLTNLGNYLQSSETDVSGLMGGINFWEVSLWSSEPEANKDRFGRIFQNSIFAQGKTPYFKPLLIEPIGEILEDNEAMETFAIPVVSSIRYQLEAAVRLMDDLQQRNIPVPITAPQVGFVTDVGTHYFLEIARLRALRLLWWQIGQYYDTRLNLVDVFVYANTIRMMPPDKEPYASMLANTTQAMAAIIGGCDALTMQPGAFTDAKDLVLAQRIARNVSVILKEESYFDKVNDPGAGSYLVENLTHQIARAVWEQLKL
jgi:methylmalonyl-CoA mutase